MTEKDLVISNVRSRNLKLAIEHINVYSVSHEKEKIENELENLGWWLCDMAEIMTSGPMVNARNRSPDIMISMKN